ncbi:MAG TPA: 4-(cytidine 5'-diphospho)-2-C-methyl-D-erythritol kinase [Hyphomicrobium sp.]|jgi:4-diphosphocytidyl-2-C-methyl-D-erythritol kinase
MLKSEFAPAKINLTLEVLGRRPDGYHELRSLVAFARDVGDVLTLAGGRFSMVDTIGPFASGIAGHNLVDRAVAAFSAKASSVEPQKLTLEKNLPVASGIGGGSADAAAALRLLSDAHPQTGLDLPEIARGLGADVPVCLWGRPVVMMGTGEHLEDVALPRDLFAVLVNPLVDVPENKTAQVFALLGARAIAGETPKETPPRFSNVRDVVVYATARGNDLEAAAKKVVPAIDTVLSELRQLDGSLLAQLSGAGPTCFALFETDGQAKAAAAALQARQLKWWIKPTRLG